MKSGHLHLYRGLSPRTELYTLGNFLSGVALLHGRESFHIYAIVDRPQVRDGWLGPFAEAALPGDATVFDLRPLSSGRGDSRISRPTCAGSSWATTVGRDAVGDSSVPRRAVAGEQPRGSGAAGPLALEVPALDDHACGPFSQLRGMGAMTRTFRSLPIVIGACLTSPSICSAQNAGIPDQVAERMLTAIGGRAAWAGLSSTINDSQQNRLDEPTIVRTVITMDFTRPRFRIETTAPNLHLIRVIDGQRNWRLNRQGKIETVPADVVREDQQWYAAHVYRTLHRIAARDPALRLAIGGQGRLEIFEGDARLAWFALDARGEPYAFGAHSDEIGSICGPWDFSRDGIRHPAWVARPDGSWRATIKALTINIRLDDTTFARPDSSKR